MANDEREPRVDDDVDITESEIDENLKETFPASDPSSWTLGCTRTQERSISRPGES